MAVNLVRGASCYKTLRIVTDVTFHICIAIVILAAVLVVVDLIAIGFGGNGSGSGWNVLEHIGIVLAAILFAGLLHAAHQAALLLVDIADCAIRMSKSGESQQGEDAVRLAPSLA
jgi:hypothetical protein